MIPLRPAVNNNPALNSEGILKRISFYAGRIWTVITSIPTFFIKIFDYFFLKTKPAGDLKNRVIDNQDISTHTIYDKLKNVEDLGFCQKIKVMFQLDQREDNSPMEIGVEACGYHSFKNALVANALAISSKVNETDFIEPSVYYSLFALMKDYQNDKRPGHRHIGIDGLTRFFNGFLKRKTESLKECLRPLHTAFLASPNAISILNVSADKDIHALLINDDSTLPFLANLQYISTAPGPLVHSFIMGDIDHWVTLILQKNEDGSISWFGCDSLYDYKKNADYLSNNYFLLDDLIKNPSEALKAGYSSGIGAELERATVHLSGQIIDNPQDPINLDIVQKILAGIEIEDYCKKLENAFTFLKRVGWLEKLEVPAIYQHLIHLNAVAQFLHSYTDLPILGEILATLKDIT